MIRLITREQIFSNSQLVDNYISYLQTAYQRPVEESEDVEIVEPDDEDGMAEPASFSNATTDAEGNKYSWDEPGSLVKDLEDHLEPRNESGTIADDFAVLGYLKKKTVKYELNRSKAMIRFFEIMNIRQLYLMDLYSYDWLRFPFGDNNKLAAMRSLVDKPSYRQAFKLDIEDLATILPWFNHSGRGNMPIIFLFSTDEKVTIAMFLCDDGNFHTNFHPADREKIYYAASAVGLTMGGVEIC